MRSQAALNTFGDAQTAVMPASRSIRQDGPHQEIIRRHTAPDARESNAARLSRQFDEALQPLRDAPGMDSLEQVRQNFLAIQPGPKLEPEVAGKAFAQCVHQMLDTFGSTRGEDALQALRFVKELFDQSQLLPGFKLTAEVRQSLAERLRATRPRDHRHASLLDAVQAHAALSAAAAVEAVTMTRDARRNSLQGHMDAILEMSFDDAFAGHWQSACATLPLLGQERRQETVHQLSDTLDQNADEADLADVMLTCTDELLQAAARIPDVPSRVTALEAADKVLRQADLSKPQAQVVLYTALALKPDGGDTIQESDPVWRARGSKATRSLLEAALGHVVKKDLDMLANAVFDHAMEAAASLAPHDAASIQSRTQQMAAFLPQGLQWAKVALARLSVQALRPMAGGPAAANLIGMLNQHLTPLTGQARADLRGPRTVKLVDELRTVADSAGSDFLRTRLDALQAKILPGQPG